MSGNSQQQRVQSPVLLLAVALLPLLTSCATYSNLHAAAVPPHSLRLAEVVYLASRTEIMQEPEPGNTSVYKNLLASGVKDSEIKDGSVAIGRVYCCGGKTEKAFAFLFYVPAELRVRPGDFVEVKSGPVAKSGEIATPVNTVTRVVEKSACRWDPPDPWKYLTSVLYCDWMEKEGWKRHKGALADANVWIKQP